MDRLRDHFREYSSEWRFWLTVASTTVLMMVSYAAFLFGFASVGEAEATVVGSSIGTGVALVPLTFGVAAFFSGTPRSLVQIAKGTAWWFALAPPLMFFDIILGLMVGFGVGSAVATRLPDGRTMTPRLVTVGVVTVITALMLFVWPAAAVFGGMLTLYPAVALSDRAPRTRFFGASPWSRRT